MLRSWNRFQRVAASRLVMSNKIPYGMAMTPLSTFKQHQHTVNTLVNARSQRAFDQLQTGHVQRSTYYEGSIETPRKKRRIPRPADPDPDMFDDTPPKEPTKEITTILRNLETQVSDQFDTLPAIWYKQRNDSSRYKLFQEVNKAVQVMKDYVEQRHLKPFGDHRAALSNFCERILRLYSELHHNNSTDSVFHQVSVLLKLMKKWQLELLSAHTDFAVIAAAREGRWREATDIFYNGIDPDKNGLMPYTLDVKYPVGLYAVARSAKEQGSAVVDSVFEAVSKMRMACPDQDQCK
jgi:phage gp36-like protein